jgi:hypothetical protein
MPSRQERRNTRVESTLFLIHRSASRTIGPAIVPVDVVGVDARVLPVVRVPAVDAELLEVVDPAGFGQVLPSVYWEFLGG